MILPMSQRFIHAKLGGDFTKLKVWFAGFGTTATRIRRSGSAGAEKLGSSSYSVERRRIHP